MRAWTAAGGLLAWHPLPGARPGCSRPRCAHQGGSEVRTPRLTRSAENADAVLPGWLTQAATSWCSRLLASRQPAAAAELLLKPCTACPDTLAKPGQPAGAVGVCCVIAKTLHWPASANILQPAIATCPWRCTLLLWIWRPGCRMGLARLEVHVLPHNERSRQLAQRMGFSQQARLAPAQMRTG